MYEYAEQLFRYHKELETTRCPSTHDEITTLALRHSVIKGDDLRHVT
jgi:hypothetical protein